MLATGARPLGTPALRVDHFSTAPIAHALPRQQRCRALAEAVLISTVDAASISMATSEAFQARMDPAIAVAAAVAAVPPILFWVRIALNEQRRRRETEEKERARLVRWRPAQESAPHRPRPHPRPPAPPQELKKKLFGD